MSETDRVRQKRDPREFGMEFYRAIGENQASVTKVLREAGGGKFEAYIGGYEQACWNLRKLLVELMQKEGLDLSHKQVVELQATPLPKAPSND